MARHLKPGGLLVVEPWFTPQNYWVDRLTANFVDLPQLKIAWMYVSRLKRRLSIFDIQSLVGTPAGVHAFTEKHEMGLFTHRQYLDAFRKAGCTVHHDKVGLMNRGLYWGTRL
jgi:hypothetical protein